jgi:hypothetical protein
MMDCDKIDNIRKILDEGILGKTCVQTWIGYGQVVFLGFGYDIIPPVKSGERHPMPPYELETGFADWWIEKENKVIGTSNDERKMVETTASLLIGQQAISWEFTNSTVGLTLTFSDDFYLKMVPYTDGNVSNEMAWCFRTPYCYIVVNWDGTVETGQHDE